MRPTINWCAFCKHWRGGYTPKCQFCEMYCITVRPSNFEQIPPVQAVTSMKDKRWQL